MIGAMADRDADDCPFCTAAAAVPGRLTVALPDAFPVTEGHVLVVPTRHVARMEHLTDDEWDAVFRLVRDETRRVAALPGVTGVNLGVNSGPSAGQTISHAHVHVIPRREGDVDDPRGGVRWVVPSTAAYWGPG